MKTSLKLLIFTLTMIVLAGCKETQLVGPVTNATIYIDLLNQRGANYQLVYSDDTGDMTARFGLFEWLAFSEIEKLVWLGNYEIDNQLIQADQLYLVAARGGNDRDSDSDGSIDPFPEEVSGEWHAIVPGKSLLANCARVSALTEAAYQSVRDQIGYITDEELLAMLGSFAEQVITDTNRDMQVDNTDLLNWSRMFSTGNYLGDIELLDALAEAIVADAEDAVLRAAAESVLRNQVVEPIPPSTIQGTKITSNITGNAVWTRSQSPYILPRQLTIQGDLLIEPGVIVKGGGGYVTLYGNLHIEGLARQRVVIEDLFMTVQSFGPNADNVVRNADIIGGELVLRIQHLLIEESNFSEANLRVSNVVASEDSAAVIQRNIFEGSKVTLGNSSPVRPDFELGFYNNALRSTVTTMIMVVSSWEGPVENLVVQNNTFDPSMTVLLSTPVAMIDIRYNYWGPMGFPGGMKDTVIPVNPGINGVPSVRYLPYLVVADPETPVVW